MTAQRGGSPAPSRGAYIIIPQRERNVNMKKSYYFWLCSLVFFVVISKAAHSKLFAVAGIVNALLVLCYIAERVWAIYHE